MIKNKTILITGASSGLGKKLVEEFVINNKVIGIQGKKECDFRYKEEVEILAKSLVDENIDIIIHCAGGGFGLSDVFLEWDKMDELFSVNYMAPATLNKYLIPRMIDKGYGRVIHVSSTAARSTGAYIGYSCTKAAVLSYIRLLGNKLANTGVVVTGIIPGTFIAEGNNWHRHIMDNSTFLDEYIESNCPKGKLGEVDDIIPLVKFLCSDDAKAMCGCAVPIDNGEGVTYP